MRLLERDGRPDSGERSGFDERLGHEFADPDLLTLALTHRSWCAEHSDSQSNERLEFLGDAILGMIVTEYLFTRFPDMPEGELAKTRAAVVSAAPLAQVGGSLQLNEYLRLGKGLGSGAGRATPAIVADAMEAVIGAVYLDGGIDAARALVLTLFGDLIDEASAGPGERDFKTQLQELAARLYEELPVYELRGEGPDHAKHFHARVLLGGAVRGVGEGRSKKQAEQAAAQAALQRLTDEPGQQSREAADA